MEINISFLETLKLGAKLIAHRFQQYRLRTNETVERETKYGPVLGVKRKTAYNDYYYSFEGIPYAKPPLGELRFRAPQAPDCWQQVRDCRSMGKKPMQQNFVMKAAEGDEDCLYINIYAKKLVSEKPLPVLVWIYGGGFQVGEATRDLYSPDYFMMKDVIIVTFNYRVGALGFLTLQDPDIDVPGNAGLKDQVMALRWIKANIAHFNGDAENITVFGESAGAASTNFMMLTQQAQGLFHKAILQSGVVMCPFARPPQHDWSYRLAHALGYKGANNDKEVFRFLAQAPAQRIVAADNNLLSDEEKRKHLFVAFGPVVEPYITADCVLPKPLKEMLKTAWGNDIPIIIGGNSFEGLLFYQNTLMEPHKVDELNDCEEVLPYEVIPQHSAAELKEMGLQLRAFYFGNVVPSMKETFFNYMQLLSIKHFWLGIQRVLLARFAYAPHTATYLYRFDFDSPDFNHYRVLKCGRGVRGVCHADDLSYLFYNLNARKLPADSAELKTIKRMIDIWTAFASNSNPNCDSIKPSVWQPLSSNDSALKCLNISEDVSFIELPEKQQIDMWTSFFVKDTLI